MATGKPKPKNPGDDEVRLLLARYKCPVPFHAVRTRFLGSIASPETEVSPIEAVKGLWGGTLPAFDSIESLNELLGALVMGLWNRLARHLGREVPFRLVRVETRADREGLNRLALIRREEVEGFIEGLFGTQEEMGLPERANRAIHELAWIRGFFQATQELTLDASKPAPPTDINETLQNVHALTKIAEHEIHETVLSCTKARREMLQGLTTMKPTLH